MTAACLLDTNILLHLANLLATMKANGVTRLPTCNAADFPAESGVSILTSGG